MSDRRMEKACERLAVRYAGDGATEGEVRALAQRLLAASKAVVSLVGEEEVEEEVIASAIYFIGEATRNDTPQVLLGQYPATLRTLLELLGSGVCRFEESGPFVKALSAAATAAERLFEQGGEQRAAERQRVREQAEREQGRVLSEIVSSSKSGSQVPAAGNTDGQQDGAIRTGIPAAWRPSTGNPGEWYDPTRGEEMRAARKHLLLGYPNFVVRGKHPDIKVQCIVRWGSAPLAVELRSALKDTDGEAFDDVMRQLAICPDEKSRNWQLEVAQAVDPAARPARVVMRNIVPCGLPRYVCTATWPEPQRDQRSSTPRASMEEALAELIGRIKERKTHVERARKLDVAEQLTRCGLRKAAVAFKWAGQKQVAQLSWLDLDDAKRTCASDPMADRRDAVEDAITKAHAMDDERSMDWQTAANRLLGEGEAPGGVYFESAEPLNGKAQFCCLMRWRYPTDRVLKGPPRPTRRQALMATADEERKGRQIRRDANKVLTSGGHGTQGRQQLLRLLNLRRPQWTTERATLVAAGQRTPEQDRRLRDLTTLLAIVDPSRSSQVDPVLASRLVEEELRDAARTATSSQWLPSEMRQASYLRAMCKDGACAGAVMENTPELQRECQSEGVDQQVAINALITLRLLNRKGDGRMTLSEEGVKVIMRRPGTVPSAFAAKLRAAAQR